MFHQVLRSAHRNLTDFKMSLREEQISAAKTDGQPAGHGQPPGRTGAVRSPGRRPGRPGGEALPTSYTSNTPLSFSSCMAVSLSRFTGSLERAADRVSARSPAHPGGEKAGGGAGALPTSAAGGPGWRRRLSQTRRGASLEALRGRLHAGTRQRFVCSFHFI